MITKGNILNKNRKKSEIKEARMGWENGRLKRKS